MNINLSEAADFIGGKIFGDKNIEISSFAKIEEAQSGDLTFLYHSAYEKYLPQTNASAILVKPGFNRTRDDITYIEVKDPGKAFSKLIVKYFSPDFPLAGIDKTASIHPAAVLGGSVSLGKNVVISSGCKIGNNVKIFHNTVLLERVEIGDDCIIFSNVSIRENCKLGNRVIIHSGAVIGSDGFGFYTDDKGVYNKIPQIGNVVIEDDVELGANACIDRASLGSTIIKNGVKIDNLVQIAHSVVVGENTVISALTGIAGSSKIGKHNIIAGQVGIVGHIEITDNVIIMAKSGVSKSITKPGQYFGSPVTEFKTTLRNLAHIRNLDDYSARIESLEKKIKELEEKLEKK